VKRWARKHDACFHCKRTDRKHEAKGLCVSCYGYHWQTDKVKARRKAKRIEQDTVANRYAKVRAWHEANAKRVAESKRQWRIRTGKVAKWPVGKSVVVQFAGFPCVGKIVSTPTNGSAIVVLKGGTKIQVSKRWLKEPFAEGVS
jgi:hypothetical protein